MCRWNLGSVPATVLALVYPTALVSATKIFSKGSATGVGYLPLGIDGTLGNLVGQVNHTTTMVYKTTDTPLAALNGWHWLASDIDVTRAATDRVRFFGGKLGGVFSQRASAVTAEPAGAVTSDAASNGVLGNSNVNTEAFRGSIALVAVWRRSLGFNELRRLTQGGGSGFRESNPVGLWRPGWQGRCVDESGNPNHGVITGAVQSGVRPRF